MHSAHTQRRRRCCRPFLKFQLIATSSLFVGLQVAFCKFCERCTLWESSIYVYMYICVRLYVFFFISFALLRLISVHRLNIWKYMGTRYMWGYPNVHAFTRLRQLVKQIYINYYVRSSSFSCVRNVVIILVHFVVDANGIYCFK